MSSYTKLTAPFSPEQVANLNLYQEGGYFHPFTCGNEDKTIISHPDSERGRLVATIRGWICPYCDYTQDWAHSFMADIAARESMKQSIEQLKSTFPPK